MRHLPSLLLLIAAGLAHAAPQGAAEGERPRGASAIPPRDVPRQGTGDGIRTISSPDAPRVRESAGSGLATPSEESWGDEWSDEVSRRLAEEAERKLIGEERSRLGLPAAGSGAGTERRPSPPPFVAESTDAAQGAKPVAAAAPAANDELARLLEAPRESFAALQDRWVERRLALEKGDAVEASAQEARLLELMQVLDVPEVDTFAAAVVREAERLTWSDPKLALARARFAVALGPTMPATHYAHFAASFAAEPWGIAGWGRPLLRAGEMTLSQERHLRPLLADLGASFGAALAAAGVFFVGLLAIRHGRQILHDFHHLFPKRTARIQSTLLAAMLLALPLVFGLGPLIFAASMVAVLWLYLGRRERIVAASWLILLGLLPPVAGWLAARTAWSGTPAALYDRVDRGGDLSAMPLLEASVDRDDASPEALFVAARSRKRAGDWNGAADLYRRALALRPGWAKVQVGLGNLDFLLGDLEQAEWRYQQAIEADPGLAAAWFNLSRVQYQRVDFARGQATREQAMALDRSLGSRYGGGEEAAIGANRYLVDPRLGRDDLTRAAIRPGEPGQIVGQLAGFLLPKLPAPLALWVPVGIVFMLGLGSYARGGLRPSRACQRCGRSVCGRCDPETLDGIDCGQCAYVFGRMARVDPAARVRKEAAVRRHRFRIALGMRVAAFVLAAPILMGRVARGVLLVAAFAFLASLLLLGDGLIRPAFAIHAAGGKVVVVLPAMISVYLLGLRMGLRGER